jgi:acyl-CoA synthetase (AMP-forming)/AMP-acid ligase II
METLGAFLDAVTANEPDREAVAHAPRNRVTARMTRAELRAASRVAAKKLVALGVGKGTRVGFLCPNRLDWLPIAFGALRIGAALVPFSTLWKREEIAYALSHGRRAASSSRCRVSQARLSRVARGDRAGLSTGRPGGLHAPDAPALRRVVVLDGGAPGLERWEALPSDVDDAFLDALEARVSPTDVATVFFTSGTTAQAKAVVHAHAGSRCPVAASPSVSARRPPTPGGGTCRSSGAAASSSAHCRRSPAARAPCCRSRSTPAARSSFSRRSAARSWPAGIKRVR